MYLEKFYRSLCLSFFILDLFLCEFVLRYNLHTIKFTDFKCTIHWLLVYLKSYATIRKFNFRKFLSPPQKFMPICIYSLSHPQHWEASEQNKYKQIKYFIFRFAFSQLFSVGFFMLKCFPMFFTTVNTTFFLISISSWLATSIGNNILLLLYSPCNWLSYQFS